MPKKVLIALPPGMLEQVDFIAGVEHRTRSDLIRESLRRYLDAFRRGQQPNLSVAPTGTQQENVHSLDAQRSATTQIQ